jgi:hypothetical protein
MKVSLRFVALGALVLTPLLGPLAAGSATSSGHALLAAALTDARKYPSYETYSAFTASGSPSSITYFVTTKAQKDIDTEQETGTVFIVQPTDVHRLFFRATTVHALLLFLNVSAPTGSEVGRWFYLDSSDQRYQKLAPSGPQTVATQFVIGPRAFGSAATYEGVTTLRGSKVIKLGVTSSMMSPTNALIPMVLYVTDSDRRMASATVGNIGDIPSPVTSYFSEWGTVPAIHIPSSDVTIHTLR